MVGLPRTQESQFMYEMILLMDAYDYHMLNNISHKDWIELTLDEKSSIIAGYLIELKVMNMMTRPTLEQEQKELEAINKILNDWEEKEKKTRRIGNGLRLMKATIEQSIKNRPKADDHSEEIKEVGK